jgi:hypothetical protein
LQSTLSGSGEIARAFADDTAVVVTDYSKSIAAISNDFRQFGAISGLELNLKEH